MFHRRHPESPSLRVAAGPAVTARAASRAASAVVATAPGLALAHPGDHAHFDLLHLLTQPDHLALLALAAGLAFWIVRRSRAAGAQRDRERRDRARSRDDA